MHETQSSANKVRTSRRRNCARFAAISNQRLHSLDQLRDVDRVGEGRVLHMPWHAGQNLFGLALEEDDMFEPEHRAEMRGPRVVLALGDDLDDLRIRLAEV